MFRACSRPLQLRAPGQGTEAAQEQVGRSGRDKIVFDIRYPSGGTMIAARSNDRSCPECGAVRKFSYRVLMSTWPVKCRQCGHDFFPPPDIPEVEVDPRLTRGVEPGRQFANRCFGMAGVFMMSDFGGRTTNDIRLVHGTYQRGLDHAWVEIGEDIVFDGVVQRFYDLSLIHI